MPAFLYAFRNAILITCCLSAATSIVICGYWESLRWNASRSSAQPPRDFEIATYAIGGFSEIVIAGLLFAGLKEEFAFFARIGVELPTLSVVWVLWLVNCILLYPWSAEMYPGGCDAMTEYGKNRCHEYVALGILSLLNWLLLLLYTTILFICACIGRTRGNRIWSRSVKEASFFSHLPPAPTSVQPGTMRITTSPTPTLLSRISAERLRAGIKRIKISDYIANGPSASNSTASTPSVGTKPLPGQVLAAQRNSVVVTSDDTPTPMAEVHRTPSWRVSTPITLQVPVILEPEPAVPSAAPTRYYDWWDPDTSTADETPLRTFSRRLSTISEKLERRHTSKTMSSESGTRPSSSSSTLIKKKSEARSSSRGKQGKGESKRDSDQSFIVFFP
ncbi:hypothetical protein FA13DRAFT_157333 [Coprinellus micaceus]|uniref:MARVEL domain-containing protein n=1 Tax=Coprinellus micaceus TaxID=71717 RepID=A0A4Y7TJ18_COPMI|nr:hypothetical protein FA13DRAFT_157333 [Coprinellus micaceus]